MGVSVKPQWRWVDGFEGSYQISDSGTVRSRKTGHYRELKTKHNDVTGYDFVILFSNGKSKSITIHRLVASAFIPNPDNLPCVNHKNEIKTDNRVENLEWCTFDYNTAYSSYKRRKQIEIDDLDGRLICVCPSVDTAAIVLKTTKSNVSQALKGSHTNCMGFNVRYWKEEEHVDPRIDNGKKWNREKHIIA